MGEDTGKEFTFKCVPIEEVEEEQEKVTLIAGRLNGGTTTLFWREETPTQIGDYVIVENKKDYDLVRVIGLVETTKEEARKFSNTPYDNMKKAIMAISSKRIKELTPRD